MKTTVIFKLFSNKYFYSTKEIVQKLASLYIDRQDKDDESFLKKLSNANFIEKKEIAQRYNRTDSFGNEGF